ncbi:hypothetical protein [Kingella negevensis]|uniref:hypothetical protein n=1 Tax=Kingella negevensis TaxID=1522312 RepID=UPI00050A2F0E|nr:hypothetical protein [Kingella negevensis]MDK4684119.1 hypothetical protein [Kingella negevensis]MDK4689487.1 hypothetical protein [Kingella negevensis]MDK4706775.1 hypothetical protein [Kingella negevensis]MDK4708918.1 hypothetical protein [Kingella negevensis]WII90747.1 hypothetical protein QEO93_10090 [Kingella negevensis]
MNRILLMGLLFATSTVYAQTSAQIVQKFYPNYSNKLKCRIAETEDGTYCMRVLKTETRTTLQGKLMYLLFGGNFVNTDEWKEEPVHAASGSAGVFVLREKAANDWELVAASPNNTVGSFGTAPAKSKWSFREFGKDKWGFLTTHSDVHQGHSGSHYVILAHDGGRKIGASWLGANIDDTGAYGADCEYAPSEGDTPTVAERRKCMRKLKSAESSLKILPNGKTVGGFYPLQLTLSGKLGSKTYRNQAYVVPFNAAKGQYVAPKNYPLSDIDY